MTTADPVLQDTIKVQTKVAEYEFRIPSLADEIRISMHERRIRRVLDPEGNSTVDGLDPMVMFMLRAVSVFEVLLVTCTSEWPYSKGEDGKPVVDFQKWPKDKVEEATSVGLEFQSALARFRGTGAADGQPPGDKALEG